MLVAVKVVVPSVAVSVYCPPAALIAGKSTDQRPSPSSVFDVSMFAVVVFVSPLNVTVIVLPQSAVPQIGSVTPRCTTALLS